MLRKAAFDQTGQQHIAHGDARPDQADTQIERQHAALHPQHDARGDRHQGEEETAFKPETSGEARHPGRDDDEGQQRQDHQQASRRGIEAQRRLQALQQWRDTGEGRTQVHGDQQDTGDQYGRMAQSPDRRRVAEFSHEALAAIVKWGNGGTTPKR